MAESAFKIMNEKLTLYLDKGKDEAVKLASKESGLSKEDFKDADFCPFELYDFILNTPEDLQGVYWYRYNLQQSLSDFAELPISIRIAKAVDDSLPILRESNPNLSEKELLMMAYELARQEDNKIQQDFTDDGIRGEGLRRLGATIRTVTLNPTPSGIKPLRPKFPVSEQGSNREFFRATLPIVDASTGGKSSSETIAEFGYDQGRLEIIFESGGGYEYDVSPEVFKQFAASGSKGKFLWEILRGKTPGRVIDNPNKTTPGGVGGSLVPYLKTKGNAISTSAMRKNIKEVYTKGSIKKIGVGVKAITNKFKQIFGRKTKQDFIEDRIERVVSDFAQVVSDSKSFFGPITRAGEFEYEDKNGKKQILIKDIDNLKEQFSKIKHMPAFNSHGENGFLGFIYDFTSDHNKFLAKHPKYKQKLVETGKLEEFMETPYIFSEGQSFDDSSEISDLITTEGTQMPVSIRFTDIGEGNQQKIDKLIHLAISTNLTDVDRCSSAGGKACFMSFNQGNTVKIAQDFKEKGKKTMPEGKGYPPGTPEEEKKGKKEAKKDKDKSEKDDIASAIPSKHKGKKPESAIASVNAEKEKAATSDMMEISKSVIDDFKVTISDMKNQLKTMSDYQKVLIKNAENLEADGIRKEYANTKFKEDFSLKEASIEDLRSMKKYIKPTILEVEVERFDFLEVEAKVTDDMKALEKELEERFVAP